MQLRLTGREPIYRQIVLQIRQAVATGKLPPGARLPTVRTMASQLGINVNTVSHAYAELEHAGVLVNRPGRGSFVAINDGLEGERRTRLQAILGEAVVEALSLGYSTAEVEAAFGLGLARWSRDAARPSPLAAPTSSFRLAGSHDLLLDLLAARLARESPDLRLEVTAVGSLAGLLALARDEAHLAGCHLLDADTGEYNLPFVRRLLPGRSVVVMQLAARQQGLIVRRGNPRGLTGLADLAEPGVTFVNRQVGSGTRLLLDYQLARAKLYHAQIQGYAREETTHLRVAAAVAEGEADAGLGILAAARAFDLDFIPLWQERYDLVIPRERWASRPVTEIRAALHDPEFRSIVGELGGYDVSAMGQVVAES